MSKVLSARRRQATGTLTPTEVGTVAEILKQLLHTNLTLPEAAILYETAKRNNHGEPTRLTDIAHALDMPISTVSRTLWMLGDGKYNMVKKVSVNGDRRAKQVVVDLRKLPRVRP